MKNRRFVVIYILIIIAGFYINVHSVVGVPINKSFSEFPFHIKGWNMVSKSIFDEDVLKKLKPTDYMLMKYIGSDNMPVDLYIGYHNGGKESGQIHSPKNCLPGSGWFLLREDNMSINIGSKDINFVRALYQKGEEKEMFLYWYMVKGRTLSNEYALKLAEITNSFLYGRKEAAFIRVSVPFESDENKAFSVGTKFIKDFYPTIEEFLPE